MSDTARDASPAGVASVPTVDAAAVLASHRPIWRDVHDQKGVCGQALRCRACRQMWGDAETGGCEAVLLARRVTRLEVALRRTHSRLGLIRHRGGIRWDAPGELAAIGSEWECDEILGLAEAALLAGGGHA